MFPVTVELDDNECNIIGVLYDNQIQRRERLGEVLDCSPSEIWDRIDQAMVNAHEESCLHFDDARDADLFAQVMHDELDSMEQAAVTTTFSADEQQQIRTGIQETMAVCNRVRDELEQSEYTIPDVFPTQRSANAQS